uniref:Chemokine interleukin-8-like domain-containing protein n=1 Tax=Amphiprion percula TaxID=161767 RepID=A0A3P8SQ95_AMPPE
MSAARFSLSLVVLLLVAVVLTEGKKLQSAPDLSIIITIINCLRGAGPKKCCFRFNEKPIPKDRVVGYVKTSQRCSQSALCVRPAADWVKELIRYLDAKSIPGNASNL